MNQDILKGQWKQMIGKAKTTWGKLTDDELLKIEGNAQRLTGLVQERYGASREDAEKQVRKFFERVAKAVDNAQRRRDERASSVPPMVPPI